MNGLPQVDEKSCKTLLEYVSRLRTVNRWFGNKPWCELTKEDIKEVYDAVEDGRIVTARGKPFEQAETYYRRILRSKPFEMAGKRELAREVMEFSSLQPPSEVRFIREESFRQIVDAVIKVEHRALLWLAWDIGENVSSLLRLRKRDCRREVNADTQEPEYHINLRRDILKRSRTPRTEVTNYAETVRLLDQILRGQPEDSLLFAFGHRMAAKMLARAVRITGTQCIPNGEPVTLKDLRSSMACDLLRKGWTTDEVNARLGHKPSSRELDKYVNFLALNRARPKRRFHASQVTALSDELRNLRERESLSQQRVRSLQEQVDSLRRKLEVNNRMLYAQVTALVRRHWPQPSSPADAKATLEADRGLE